MNAIINGKCDDEDGTINYNRNAIAKVNANNIIMCNTYVNTNSDRRKYQ